MKLTELKNRTINGFNSNVVSKYRNELFGIAALGILLVHSISIIEYPSAIRQLCSYGGTGVYIFVLLSGIGLYFSIKKSEEKSGEDYKKADFYKKRFVRILIPYALIAGVWYGIKYFIFEHDILGFLYEFSTLSFWTECKGAWYIAMLIPLYLIYPFFHNWAEKGNRKIKILSSIFIIFLLSVFVFVYDSSLYTHFSQVFNSYIVFLIGSYIAEDVYNYKGKNIIVMMICFCIFIAKSLVVQLKNIELVSSVSFALLGVVFAVLFAWFLNFINLKFINRLFRFFGKYSLELYLTNIFLIQAYSYFDLEKNFSKIEFGLNGMVAYGAIVVAGIVSSILFGELFSKIMKKVAKN